MATAEGQSQECQQARLVIWKDLRERPRPPFSRFHGEGIRRFEAEFQVEVCGPFAGLRSECHS